MKRQIVLSALFLLACAVLTLALRQDLAHLAVKQGDERLRAGDAAGAQAAFDRAIALGADAAPLRYNLGVGYFRKGEFDKAMGMFDAALTTAGPELAAAVYFNRGNSSYRAAERRFPHDRLAAGKLFQTAVADYGQALARTPNADDARDNLSLAQTRLAAMGMGTEEMHGKNVRKDNAEQPRSPSGARAENAVRHGSSRPAIDKADAKSGATEKSGSDDELANPAKSRRELAPNMTLTEAERLLNDARGRDKPAGPLLDARKHGRMGKPEMDW